jgi:hypothetical protein
MDFFRRHIIFRVICVLLAVHIVNVSIDTPDGQPYYMPEDLSINDQESVVELVLEKGLGMENAVAEHDEPGDESQDLELIKEFKRCNISYPEIKLYRSCITVSNLPYQEGFLSQYTCDITPPPPKA